MARPIKVRKNPSQKQVRDAASTATVAAGNTTAATRNRKTSTFDGPAAPHSPIKDDDKGYIDASSSNAQITAVDKKPRAESISTRELNAMASEQLLASLGSTIPASGRVRVSISSNSTHRHTSKPLTGLQKFSRSAVAAWPFFAGATVLFTLLMVLLLSMVTGGSLLL